MKTESNNNVVVNKVHQLQTQAALVCNLFIEKSSMKNGRIRLTTN